MKQPAVIIDVNGTLGSTEKRSHFIDKEPRDWNGFFDHMMTDSPVDMVHRFVNAQWEHPFYSKIIMITGAPEKYRPLMLEWFKVNKINYDYLYMRGNTQFIKGFEFKEKLCREVLLKEFDIVLALEDKMECVEMYRKLGIPCWLVASCIYERPKIDQPIAEDFNPYRQKYRRTGGAPRAR